MNSNFFHEMNRAPVIHFTAEALNAEAVDIDTATTDYEKFLKSIGQLRSYKLRQAGR